MRNFFLLIFFVIPFYSISQQYYTNVGITEFDGSKAAFEPIRAKNESSRSIFDLATAEIAAIIMINKFEFRLGLMQEHFNENYLESYKYPKSTFEGKILNFENIKLNDSFKEVFIKGFLTIKDTKKEILAKGLIKKLNDKIQLKSSFSINLSDYDIKIPRIVFSKIDEKVKINLNYTYGEKK